MSTQRQFVPLISLVLFYSLKRTAQNKVFVMVVQELLKVAHPHTKKNHDQHFKNRIKAPVSARFYK